jgi:ribokinase
LRISVVGNINKDLNAVIGDSVNSEENRINKLGLSSGGSAANTAIMRSRLGGKSSARLWEISLRDTLSKGVHAKSRDGYAKWYWRTGLCFALSAGNGNASGTLIAA